MSNFIQDANWRYATKKFDASKKVSNEDLNTIKEAIRLSASSYGLQPYQVLIIENSETRTLLQPASWGQSQIVDASHVIVFAIETNFGNDNIDKYIKNLTETRGIPTESVQGYADFMKMKINDLTEEQKNIWTAKQAYIALGNLLNAAAELKIDATPMEGFESAKYDEILGLEKQGLHTVVVAAIGYRHPDFDVVGVVHVFLKTNFPNAICYLFFH